MADPDQQNMSNYGAKTYNPEEEKRQWKEHVNKEISQNKNHPINKAEHFNIRKKDPRKDRNINFYNSEKNHDNNRTYDR